jgi:hypothetical protein
MMQAIRSIISTKQAFGNKHINITFDSFMLHDYFLA